MFEQAIALDPQYALAYARLSVTYWRGFFLEPGPAEPGAGLGAGATGGSLE